MADKVKSKKQFAHICTVYGSKDFPKCDICQKEDALFDAMLVTGRYGYMCLNCFMYSACNTNPLDSRNTLMLKNDISKEEQDKIKKETTEYIAANQLPTESYISLFTKENIEAFIVENQEILTSGGHVGILIRPFMPLKVLKFSSYKNAESVMSIQGEPVSMRAITYSDFHKDDGSMIELLGNDACIDSNLKYLYLKSHFFNSVGNLLISKYSNLDDSQIQGFDLDEEGEFGGRFQSFTEEDLSELVSFINLAFHSRQSASLGMRR